MSMRTLSRISIIERGDLLVQVRILGGASSTFVMRLLDAGKLGCYQIGDRRIVAESHLQEFLLLSERKATVKALP
jgi:hypothetical protein